MLVAGMLASSAMSANGIGLVIVNQTPLSYEPAIFQPAGDANGLSACTTLRFPEPTRVCAPAGSTLGGLASILIECGFYDFQVHLGAAETACEGPFPKLAQSDVPDNMLSLLAALAARAR